MRYYLGADLGATKTHTLIVDETGRAVGFGESGPGNHESVGYDGMFQSMKSGMAQALRAAGLSKADIAGAGFGWQDTTGRPNTISPHPPWTASDQRDPLTSPQGERKNWRHDDPTIHARRKLLAPQKGHVLVEQL